jgi:hypothetical protein
MASLLKISILAMLSVDIARCPVPDFLLLEHEERNRQLVAKKADS